MITDRIGLNSVLLPLWIVLHSVQLLFYENCRNSRALIGLFLWSISGQTLEFIIYAMRQRARADNLTFCFFVLCLNVTLVISAFFSVCVFDCFVSNGAFFVFCLIVTLVMHAFCVLCLIVTYTLVICAFFVLCLIVTLAMFAFFVLCSIVSVVMALSLLYV